MNARSSLGRREQPFALDGRDKVNLVMADEKQDMAEQIGGLVGKLAVHLGHIPALGARLPDRRFQAWVSSPISS